MERTEEERLERDYDISGTAEWIDENRLGVVSLQFPDEMLADSYRVCDELKRRTGKSVFISVDTTYSNCCVDEISARHVNAEAIVHYGHACLSPTASKVLYVHPKSPLDVDAAAAALRSLTDPIVFYHPSYDHLSRPLCEAVFRTCPNALIGVLKIDKGANAKPTFGRHLIDSAGEIKDLPPLEDRRAVYIGGDDQTLFNLAVALRCKGLHVLDPIANELRPYSQSAWLKRRRYIVEKCKDADNIAILVCTLSVANFRLIIERLKKLIRLSGKRSYVLTLGRPNVAKLSNLYEMDAFVLIACPENDLYGCRDFLVPLAYPIELEFALNGLRDPYASAYFTDFNDLLADGKGHCDVVPKELDGDVSLITGRQRAERTEDGSEDGGPNGTTEVVARERLTMAKLTIGDHLGGRSWKGLEQKLGETAVKDVEKGRSGIAGGYQEEPQK